MLQYPEEISSRKIFHALMGNETPRLHERTGAGDKMCFCAGSVMVGLRNLGGPLESNLATTVICSDFSGNDRGNIVV